MDISKYDDEQLVKVDFIFLIRRLIEAEDNQDAELQKEIRYLLYSIRKYSEEHKHMPYGPIMKIRSVKKMFPLYVNSCPALQYSNQLFSVNKHRSDNII